MNIQNGYNTFYHIQTFICVFGFEQSIILALVEKNNTFPIGIKTLLLI